jgi:tRNA pseudouridine65 synthase
MTESNDLLVDKSPQLTPEDIKILYQDDNIVIVDKPSWLIVHPFKRFHHERTNLMKLVRDRLDQYVYPIHRLDRQVSGPVIFGLSSEAAKEIQKHWHGDQTKKEYITLCKGQLEGNGQFNFPLRDGKYKKKSLTLYRVMAHLDDCSLVRVEIKTGRRHQIRRHFSRRMHHIVGDRRYGHKDFNDKFLNDYGLERIFLHSCSLRIPNPWTMKLVEVTSPLPEELRSLLLKKGLEETILADI